MFSYGFSAVKVEEQEAECLVFTSYSSYIIMDHFLRDLTYTRKFDITPYRRGQHTLQMYYVLGGKTQPAHAFL